MEMNMNLENKVVMHNDLIRSKSTLSLNEIKLLRLAIMQVMKDDTDFKTYQIDIMNLADILGIDRHPMYRDVQEICKHLLKEIVYVGDGNPKHKWQMFQWVSSCRYDDGMITIKLHDDLKPYLLELKGLYTQYILEDVLMLKSTYSIRIYELIRDKLRNTPYYGENVAEIRLMISSIRKATDTEKKYERYSQFKLRVIDAAVNEINDKLQMHIEYQEIKRSRKIIGYSMRISSRYNPGNRK